MRCERCKTSELSLVTFGVYDCPSCGRVDADGNLVGGSEGRADSTQPNLLDTGRASFVAPPPPSAMSASITTAPHLSGSVSGSGGIPMLFLGTVAALAIVDVAEAIQTRSPLSLLLQAGTMVALLTGKRWARTLAIAGAVLMIGLSAMLFVALRHVSVPDGVSVPGGSGYGVVAIVSIVLNGWWLYVLLRPDTVAYFSR